MQRSAIGGVKNAHIRRLAQFPISCMWGNIAVIRFPIAIHSDTFYSPCCHVSWIHRFTFYYGYSIILLEIDEKQDENYKSIESPFQFVELTRFPSK